MHVLQDSTHTVGLARAKYVIQAAFRMDKQLLDAWPASQEGIRAQMEVSVLFVMPPNIRRTDIHATTVQGKILLTLAKRRKLDHVYRTSYHGSEADAHRVQVFALRSWHRPLARFCSSL